MAWNLVKTEGSSITLETEIYMKKAIEIRTWSADKIELIFLKIIFKYLLYF